MEFAAALAPVLLHGWMRTRPTFWGKNSTIDFGRTASSGCGKRRSAALLYFAASASAGSHSMDTYGESAFDTLGV